jgi:hypothetical protein
MYHRKSRAGECSGIYFATDGDEVSGSSPLAGYLEIFTPVSFERSPDDRVFRIRLASKCAASLMVRALGYLPVWEAR